MRRRAAYAEVVMIYCALSELERSPLSRLALAVSVALDARSIKRDRHRGLRVNSTRELRSQESAGILVSYKPLASPELGQKRWWSPETAAPGYDATPPALARDRITAHFSIGHKSQCSALLLSACLLQPLHCSPPRASRPEDACRRAHCSPPRPEHACRRDDTCLQPVATHRHSRRIPC